MDQLTGTSRTQPHLSRHALFGSALSFTVGIALLFLGSMGLPGKAVAFSSSAAAGWPALYLWRSLRLPTLLCAALLEAVTAAKAARMR